jgi:hypothetical protein
MALQIAKRKQQKRRNRYSICIPAGMAAVALMLCCGCGESGAPSKPIPAKAAQPAANSGQQPLGFDACTLFSADEAAQILRTPVRPVTNIGGCSYEAANTTLEGWRRQVVLNVRKYKSPAEESSAWEEFKTLKHIHPGRQNLTPLEGIGTEAYYETIPSGKLLEASVIVHSINSDFQLKAVTDQKESPDAMKSVAQKIAGQLP